MIRIVAVALLLQGPTINPAWTRVDSAAHKVELTLVAGMGGVNGGMSFNGVTAGALTAVVPTGWTVTLKFNNADQMLPHSVLIVPFTPNVPPAPPQPAFPHAASRRLAQGLPSDAHEDVSFVPDRAGSYYILCGVPGHGIAGMWLKLEVEEAPAHIGYRAGAH